MTWVGKEYCLEIINRCEPTEEGRKKQILGIDGKHKYKLHTFYFVKNLAQGIVAKVPYFWTSFD